MLDGKKIAEVSPEFGRPVVGMQAGTVGLVLASRPMFLMASAFLRAWRKIMSSGLSMHHDRTPKNRCSRPDRR